ncbi:MAG TPA: hypothetical protein VJU34_02895 [Phenylobacterium sp.]|nr:hypothetical protein [Phenylobacterium sp.]
MDADLAGKRTAPPGEIYDTEIMGGLPSVVWRRDPPEGHETTQETQVGADLDLRFIALRAPPSRPSSIEEEGGLEHLPAIGAGS